MKNTTLAAIISFLFISSKVQAFELDSLKTKQHFEVSFGQSLLFISSSNQISIRSQNAVVIPTSAFLFFGELRPQKMLRIPIFLNIATESKQFLVNGLLVNERASPTIGSGITFRVFCINIDKKSKVELEAGPLVSFLLDSKSKIRVAPIIGSRIKISRGENFIMYFGVTYSIGVNAVGILYGTGTCF